MRRLFLLCLAVISLQGCGTEPAMFTNNTKSPRMEIAQSDLSQLGGSKVFFGHQSVGNNIMDGVKRIVANYPGALIHIVETADPAQFGVPIWAHGKIGENFKPYEKNADFTRVMDVGLGERVHIAFYKYCYVDVDANTNVDEMFEEYRKNMLDLKERYPQVKFVHVTVPLVVVQSGLKVPIKKMLNRPVGGYDDNATRMRYNELLRMEYDGKEPLFDLAKHESTYPDGRRMLYEHRGRTNEALIQEYSKDGRHLNEYGSDRVASKLILYLKSLL